MQEREDSCQDAYTDEILDKHSPSERRSVLLGLIERKDPDEYPPETARESGTDDPPELQEYIIGDDVHDNAGKQDIHLRAWSTAR